MGSDHGPPPPVPQPVDPPPVPVNAQGTGSQQPSAEQDTPPSRRRKRRWPKILALIALILTVLLGGAVGAGVYALNHLSGNVKTVQVRTAQTPESHEALNILLMGSDSREGKGNKGYGLDAGRDGQRSDTTILLHLAADRQSAYAVSIPRDTWVEQPLCATEGVAGIFAKFNNAFDAGGPSCTTELVQQMTGVPIHHIAVVDFGGFKRVIDSLGGVEVCLNEPINDRDSQLDLPAGTTLVDGERALAFVRARKTLGDGSDIGRIKRQQIFLSSAIRKATDTGLLLNPVNLFKILDTATQSVTVDESLNDLGEMRTLVESVRGISPSDITFMTMPFSYRGDGSNVSIDEEKAEEIWTAIKADLPWPPPVSRAPDGKKLTVAPRDITVRVINASGDRALADQAALQLRSLGFNVENTGQKAKTRKTIVRYPESLSDSARTVGYVADSKMKLDQNSYAPTLYVGTDWSTVKSSIVLSKPKSTQKGDSTEPTKADEPICAER